MHNELDFRGRVAGGRGTDHCGEPLFPSSPPQVSPEGKSVGHRIVAEGWLQPNGTVWGRPVGLLVMPDGSVLMGDDTRGAVYRISYEGGVEAFGEGK